MDKVPPTKEKRSFPSHFYAGILFLVVGGLFILFNPFATDLTENQPEPKGDDIVDTLEGYERRAIDGVLVSEEELPKRLYGVMIENSAEAWPLSAVSEARLVIEAPVEGNIPRLLAFYDETQTIDQIGSVRSARPYYVSWARGFNAMYTHVGGSPEALATLREIDLNSTNEFYWGNYFWRAHYRYAPHNVYTNIELLTDVYDEREFEQKNIPSWEYKEQIDASGEQIESVSIPFSSASSLYTAKWKYLPDEQVFLRHQGKNKQEDTSDNDVKASNVIVLYTSMRTIDDEGRKYVKTVGEGDGVLFRDGISQEITWKKTEDDAPLEFFIENEKAFLKPGTTWIEVIPLSTEVSVVSRVQE